MKLQLESKQTLGPAIKTLSASVCDRRAAEVNASHALIVLWSRHGALAPRRVRLTKVKSAGSIKAHLRVAKPPPLSQAAGLWEGLFNPRHLFTATNNNKLYILLVKNMEQELWWWWWWFELMPETGMDFCRPSALCCFKLWTESTLMEINRRKWNESYYIILI